VAQSPWSVEEHIKNCTGKISISSAAHIIMYGMILRCAKLWTHNEYYETSL